jgi:sialic acid synthase SpsE
LALIIAEIGVNHNGQVGLAKTLIDAAKAAGANAVKFQVFDAKLLDPPGERRDMLKKLQLSYDDFKILAKHAQSRGVEFIATPFAVDALSFLVNDLKVKTLKIASGNLDNTRLLKAAKHSGCKLIISTGMATMPEISRARHYVKKATWLHCTSAYPAPIEDVNLLAILDMAKKLKAPVGLSDHTASTVIPAAAVALGAEVIEKHFTLDNNLPGPDHKASLEPDKFAEMVRNIKEVEASLGDGQKRPQQSEFPVMGIVAERRQWRS